MQGFGDVFVFRHSMLGKKDIYLSLYLLIPFWIFGKITENPSRCRAGIQKARKQYSNDALNCYTL